LSLAQLLLLLLAMLSSGLLAYDRLVLSKPIDQRAPGGIGEFNIGVPAAHFKMMQMRASDIHRRVALSVRSLLTCHPPAKASLPSVRPLGAMCTVHWLVVASVLVLLLGSAASMVLLKNAQLLIQP